MKTSLIDYDGLTDISRKVDDIKKANILRIERNDGEWVADISIERNASIPWLEVMTAWVEYEKGDGE